MNLLRQLHIKTEPLVYMSEKPKEQKKNWCLKMTVYAYNFRTFTLSPLVVSFMSCLCMQVLFEKFKAMPHRDIKGPCFPKKTITRHL